MRPLYLEMEAFGPFYEKQKIDFQKLSDKHIFLVSGPTGAGKTSIFDAITYALYNKTSGKDRGINHIKSDYADYTKTCYVELSFENKGKVYKIIRKPDQKITGKSGREIDFKHQVQLFVPGKEPITRANEVEEEIQKIIGLDFNRFSQIVMLPQGEFRKFLQSKSGEKQGIFRDIFLTHKYNTFTELLKEKSKEYRGELARKKDVINTYISMIKTSSAEFSAVLETEDKSINLVLEHLKTELIQDTTVYIEDTKVLEDLKKEQKNLDLKNILMINSKILRSNEIKDILKKQDGEKEKYDNFEKEIDLASSALTVDSVFLQIEEREQEKSKEMKQEKISKKEMIKRDKNFEVKKSEMKENSKREIMINEAEEEIKKIDKDLESLGNLEDIKKTKATLLLNAKKTESQVARIKSFIKRVEIKAELSLVDEKLKEINNIITSINEKPKYLETALKRKKYFDTLYDLQMAGQSGVLASILEDDHPCPVCGSKEHPKIAKITKEMPTQAEVDEAHKNFIHANSQLKSLETTLKLEIRNLNEKHNKSLSEERPGDIKNYKLSLNKNKTEIEKKVVEQEKLCLEGLVETDFILKKEYQEKEWLLKKLNTKEIEKVEINSRINSLEEQKKEIEKKLPIDSLTLKQLNEKKIKTKENISKNEDINTKIKKSYDSEKEEIIRLGEYLLGLENSINNHNSSIKRLDDRYKELLVQFSFKDAEDFKKHLRTTKEVEELQHTVLEYKNLSLRLKEEKKVISKDIEGKKYENTEVLELRNQAIEKSIVETEKSASSLFLKIENNKSQEKNILKIYEELLDKEEKSNLVTHLSKVADGSAGSYVSFERYILSAYFGQIIQASNHRFSMMTMGQFRFVYKNEKASHGATSGLDLSVFDSHTGSQRGVDNLSGGESFIASLSLALGLSDVIQSHSGGIHIETMFIDEGFGSLDNETLDTVITSLTNLEDEQKLIGIISHVNELKERIPTHLQVDASTTGSSIKLVEN